MHVYGVIEGRLALGAISASVTPDVHIIGSVSTGQRMSGALTQNIKASAKLSSERKVYATLSIPSAIGANAYKGVYEVTPTKETQTLETVGTLLQKNVVINPIPKNYGLITWDGSTLTVS